MSEQEKHENWAGQKLTELATKKPCCIHEKLARCKCVKTVHVCQDLVLKYSFKLKGSGHS